MREVLIPPNMAVVVPYDFSIPCRPVLFMVFAIMIYIAPLSDSHTRGIFPIVSSLA